MLNLTFQLLCLEALGQWVQKSEGGGGDVDSHANRQSDYTKTDCFTSPSFFWNHQSMQLLSCWA